MSGLAVLVFVAVSAGCSSDGSSSPTTTALAATPTAAATTNAPADEFGQSGWTLQVSGNSPTSVGVLLNTATALYANDASLGNGTINAQADLHHSDFDLELVEMAHQDITVHVSGSIDCP